PLYRAYSDGASDHFYTTDLAEYNSAVAGGGYTAEGVRLLVFTTQVAGSVQFIRLWNGDKSDHFYTTNATEAKSAVTGGYVIEDKTPMYIYPTQICGSVPLYRSYSQTGTDHFYTIDAAERDGAVGSGWAYEWIAGYVFPPSSGSSGTTTKTTTTATTATATTTTTTGKTTTTTAAAPSPTASAPSPSTSNSSASSTTDDGLTAPVLPAPTTVLGGSFADTLPTTSYVSHNPIHISCSSIHPQRDPWNQRSHPNAPAAPPRRRACCTPRGRAMLVDGARAGDAQ
ncbi:hypothetical protein FB451DRAFT_1026358, partial [Mycena latifolia]